MSCAICFSLDLSRLSAFKMDQHTVEMCSNPKMKRAIQTVVSKQKSISDMTRDNNELCLLPSKHHAESLLNSKKAPIYF